MGELSGFYKLSLKERLELLKKEYCLDENELALLKNGGSLDVDIANRMIENVVGIIHLPLGLATNFRINGTDFLVPMAIEEASVIAGASKAAKLSLPEGFSASADQSIMTGQIQLVGIKSFKDIECKFKENKKELLSLAVGYSKHLEKYGGGVRGLDIKSLKTKRGEMVIVEFDVDVCDAMGANMVNTLLEDMTQHILDSIGGKIRARILTNLAIKRLARSRTVWKKEVIGEDEIEGILDMYEFASNDIFRCATHNKGIMNGIDAVALATGNDWRAIEAGAHAYASMNGYHALTKYEQDKNGDLVGSIELPLAVATVGGAIGSLQSAKLALKILNVKTSKELAMVMASVGLANNFAAVYALSSEGIQKGHMKLHARNIAINAGAKEHEIEKIAEDLVSRKNFSLEFAKERLEKMRPDKKDKK